MKVSIERSALLKAMSQAQSVVERRNTIPILANVLIEAEGGEISFRATDLDIEVVYKVVGMVEQVQQQLVRILCMRLFVNCQMVQWLNSQMTQLQIV